MRRRRIRGIMRLLWGLEGWEVGSGGPSIYRASMGGKELRGRERMCICLRGHGRRMVLISCNLLYTPYTTNPRRCHVVRDEEETVYPDTTRLLSQPPMHMDPHRNAPDPIAHNHLDEKHQSSNRLIHFFTASKLLKKIAFTKQLRPMLTPNPRYMRLLKN